MIEITSFEMRDGFGVAIVILAACRIVGLPAG